MVGAEAQLVLASASPRRVELLEQLGLGFVVEAVDIDETVRVAEAPVAYTQRLARSKALACQARAGETVLIVAADTAVVADSQILGKPASRAEARQMLRGLAGGRHEVITSFALRRGEREVCQSCTTEVWMAALSERQIRDYVASGEPDDKAGGYAIQGRAAAFIERIEGSYSNVVGLPLYELAAALQQFEIGNGPQATTP